MVHAYIRRNFVLAVDVMMNGIIFSSLAVVAAVALAGACVAFNIFPFFSSCKEVLVWHFQSIVLDHSLDSRI